MAAAAIALTLALGDAGAAAAEKAATCRFGGASRVLQITVRRDRAEDGRAGSVYVATRRRAIYVFGGSNGDAVPCSGPSPTTLNVDTVRITAAAKVRAARVYVDQRGGVLAPGNTDEGDGSSEIEFEIDLPRRGLAYFLMTQGDDAVYARDLGAQTLASLNPFEAPFDFDVTVNGGGLIVLGLGGDDLLSAAPSPPGPYDEYAPSAPEPGFGIGLLGGAGSDGLFGSPAADALIGGGGTDLVIGGAGDDGIATRDRTRDFVDCGDGRDQLTSDRRDRTHACEARGGAKAARRATRLSGGVAPDHLPLGLRRR